MRKPAGRRPPLPATLTALILAPYAFGAAPEPQRPPGEWSFSARPFNGGGYDARPVTVFSVASNVKDLSGNAVGVLDNSSKAVTAVKLGRGLTSSRATGREPSSGGTPPVTIPQGLPAGADPVINFPITSFLKVYQTLWRAGVPGGATASRPR